VDLCLAPCRYAPSAKIEALAPRRCLDSDRSVDSASLMTRTGGTGHGCLGPGRCNRRDEKSERELSISVGVVRRRGGRRGSAVTETEERSMHPVLFEYWWRNESARVEQRAKTAPAVREATLGEASWRSSRALRMLGTVRSGWRRAGLVPAGALAYGQRVGGHRSPPATAATLSGKRG
jgi:hypothetical protein